MLTPTADVLPRMHDAGQAPDAVQLPGAGWDDLEGLLRAGSGTTWLSVPAEGRVHVRPVFAAWTGSSFVVASNPGTVKSRCLDEAGACTLAIDLQRAHLVVEGAVVRLTAPEDLERASAAMHDVYDWPTTISGDRLDAPYAAPSSGGPPFNAYEITPVRAHAFPTQDQFDPTRFTFGPAVGARRVRPGAGG